MAGAPAAGTDAAAEGGPKVKDGFDGSVVLDAALLKLPNVDDDPPKSEGLGASTTEAGVATSAGLGCSLGCPKTKALAVEAGFAGAAILAGGPNADGAAPSAA